MSDIQSTHFVGCADSGPRHYDCLLGERNELRAQLSERDAEIARLKVDRDKSDSDWLDTVDAQIGHAKELRTRAEKAEAEIARLTEWKVAATEVGAEWKARALQAETALSEAIAAQAALTLELDNVIAQAHEVECYPLVTVDIPAQAKKLLEEHAAMKAALEEMANRPPCTTVSQLSDRDIDVRLKAKSALSSLTPPLDGDER